MRELEYDYTIELPDGWQQDNEDRFSIASPWAHLEITSRRLPLGFDVDQLSQLVQGDLRKDWWPNASLFEITSVEEGLTDNQPTIRVRYRIQESPQYCVVNVEELVVVSQILAGYPHGFRVRAWMCEQEVANYGKARQSILDSFHVATVPAEYYTQFLPVKGLMVKAHESVEPAALQAGAEIVAAMLSGREDIALCMPLQGADLAIIPKDKTNTDLPEFTHLVGTKDFTGRRRDTFEIRGLGGVIGQPVSSAGEEQLLENWGPQHPWFPYRGWVALHEFAHAIQNLCFAEEDHEEWNKFYEDALEANLYPGSHMMADTHEFFAEFSQGYFEVTDNLGKNLNRSELWDRFPEIFQFLDEIYGGATLPEEYRTWTERQN